MFSEFLQEQTRKLVEVIGDYWYYEDGDCYVPSNVQTIQALDKTNTVTVGLNAERDGYMCHTSCLINNEIVPYTLEEYHEEFCELRDDGKYHYVKGARECGCQDKKKSNTDLDELVSEIVKNTVEGTPVPDDYDDLNDLVEQKVEEEVAEEEELGDGMVEVEIDDENEESRGLTGEAYPRDEESRGLTGEACPRDEESRGLTGEAYPRDEESRGLMGEAYPRDEESRGLTGEAYPREECKKSCIRKLLNFFHIGN